MLRSALLVLGITLSALPALVQEPLEQRLSAAQAATTLRRAYFDAAGERPLTLEQAFSHLAGAPLSDPSFLVARQRVLDDQRNARARERLEAGGSERAEAVVRACNAEDGADALEARLLSALVVGLEIAPGFTADSVELARRPWQAARERALRMPEDDADFERAQREAAAAAEAERLLLLYQSSALRRMTLPDDPGLARLAEAEAEPEMDEGMINAEARDRLTRAAPLLGAGFFAKTAGPAGPAVDTTSGPNTATAAAERQQEGDELQTTVEFRAAERERHSESLETIRLRASRYSELHAELVRARALSLLDDSRAGRLRESALASNDLVRAIRDDVSQLLEIQLTHNAQRRELVRGVTETEASGNNDESLVSVLDERDSNTADEIDALLEIEKNALVMRRRLQRFGDTMSRQALFDELSTELGDAPLWLKLEWHKDVRWLRSLPERSTDLNTVGEFIEVSFDLLLLAFFWIYLRDQTPRWMNRAVAAVRKKDVSRFGFGRWTRRVGDRELEPVGRFGTDAVGAFALHRLLLPRSEFLALLALIWVGWALLKCVPAAVRLALPFVGRALDPLEADSGLPAEVQALGEKTVSWFLWWWIIFSVAAFIAVPLLQADRLAQVVQLFSVAVFMLLLVVALTRWSTWTRQFLANLADQSAISTWLARPVRSRIWRIVRTAFGSIYILARLVFWALVDRGWLSRSGTSIALSQLKLVDTHAELLSSEERDQIRAAATATIERTQELEVLRSAFESWQRERRRGIVAVIGDNGAGKSVFLEQARRVLEATGEDLPVTKLELPVQKRSTSLRERLEWLTVPLELAIPKNATRSTLQKTVIDHLESLPPHVFLVDDLHFLLRRTVGGFDALEIARNIIQACADEHFWVLTLHRPAWVYVDGVSTAMKLAFRERIELPSLDAERLGESLIESTRAAGFDPEFKSLLLGRRPYADKETIESKARRLYWRIVSQSSQGNARVVVDFWLSSLGASKEAAADNGAKTVPVYLFAGHGDEEVVSLSDEYLFLLSALVVHDGLKVEDLAEVLNEVLSKVRVACQHLEGLGIISEVKRRYLVTPGWQPTVARVLDRRNFSRH